MTTTRRPGTTGIVVRTIGMIVSVIAFLVGGGLMAMSLAWLWEIDQNPPEPPGQMVAIIPMAGAAGGFLLMAVAVGGIASLLYIMRMAWRPRG